MPEDLTEGQTLLSANMHIRRQECLRHIPSAIQPQYLPTNRFADSIRHFKIHLPNPGIHVIEGGNGLYLAEQADGLIADWDFMKKSRPPTASLSSQASGASAVALHRRGHEDQWPVG